MNGACRLAAWWLSLLALATLAACGGGSDDSDDSAEGGTDDDEDDASPADDDDNDNDDTVDVADWTWSKWEGDGPSARVMARMAYVESIDRVVMFGGGLGWPTNETWRWDGAAWTEANPAHKPRQRLAPAMAYDAGRQRLVVFGGTALTTFRNDTWEFDGEDWAPMSPANKPAIRAQAGMVYEAKRERVLLFGGCNSDECYNNLGDTWAYDGADWAPLSPAHSPSPRNGGAMFYDPQMELVVYYGGVSDDKGTDETWLFDGEDWTLATPDLSPPARYTPAADCATTNGGGCVMFGGDGGYTYGYLNDTWLWRDGQWTELGPLDPAPSPRTQMVMGFDPSAQQFVMHGGFWADLFPQFYGDTWLFAAP
jgi:hypothetical protein